MADAIDTSDVKLSDYFETNSHSMTELPSLKIGKHIARYPIIQGGMGIRISGANLAAAVANAGGIGIISAVGLGLNSPYFDPKQKKGNLFSANRLALIDELQRARAMSPNGAIGINCMMAARDCETLVRTAAEYGADSIVCGAGLPLNLPEYTHHHPDVALDRAARGDVENGLIFAGSNAGRATQMVSVAELMAELVA